MLEQIKRATEVDADVIGDRLSAVENIRGQIIRVWSGGGRCIEDRRRRTRRNGGGRWIADRGGRIVMTKEPKYFNLKISGKGRLPVFR